MSYYYFQGFLDILEGQIQDRLAQLGVPEEDYQKLAEYMSKDEILELEAKAKLAAALESSYILSDEANIDKLKQVFELPENRSLESYARPYATPTEYKDLSDLLTEYDNDTKATDDYDD